MYCIVPLEQGYYCRKMYLRNFDIRGGQPLYGIPLHFILKSLLLISQLIVV